MTQKQIVELILKIREDLVEENKTLATNFEDPKYLKYYARIETLNTVLIAIQNASSSL